MCVLVCVPTHPNHNLQHMAPQAKPLCQRDVHQNYVQEGGFKFPISFTWTRFTEDFLELKSLGQNVNLTFQNDTNNGGNDHGNMPTTHPSWQVTREQHAQAANIPFGHPSL